MIQEQDRSGWFGASDVSQIMSNWDTKTFENWWLEKLGLRKSNLRTDAMMAGTNYEHAILKAIGAPRMDHQILLPEFQLRVNLDGDAPGEIFEVKTHMASKEFKPTKTNIRQVNVQMYVKSQEEDRTPRGTIISYALTEDDYKNYFHEIDKKRLRKHRVEYDKEFVMEFLQRCSDLKIYLERGAFPHARNACRHVRQF